MLGLREGEPTGMLILGANRVSREIAKSLKQQGFTVKLADTDWENISAARMEGFDTYYGRTVSDHADRNMELSGIGRLLGYQSPCYTECSGIYTVQIRVWFRKYLLPSEH
jgi:hypothetical protein